ncbi:MAG TPA: Wzz/FepE/Etk N-terminal domain-containing protein, partial [Syntrophorhabdaceae bacterium]|nr:Wzz/FepE/Etk N-terminal domain-containing protein [Syntrophorhabdaceae bacterium]HOT42324.1 Wzz/FepE/Etk N-terminal domain-containing protein [Syntrophorhabdaceae bacterium]HQE80553.1 Wzz/FepE/Etk N-terminal domain-containing protein [Syntrophorhabdaceae bacterium]HQK47033.1 Wzz/FepE/Etk N-terminal domain-containing protein [Syntrophorhabdaceae bacterium]HRR72287.1 Wzz/FepE/Etk N-terminal domain-containing protein [Syntrophorhabdaceae bacterium]
MEGKKLLTIRDILYIFFKNKILIISVFASAVIFSSFYCLVTPPIYRGETKVLIKMGKSNFVGMEALTEQRNVLFQERSQNIRNEIELIKGQYLTEKVIARLKDKIEPLKEDKSIIGRTIDVVKKGIREVLIMLGISKKTTDKALVLTFMSALTVRYLEDTDMISIGFDWTDPKFAALVANVYADEYVTQHTLVYETQRSHKFYVDQIELYEKKLKEAEDALQNFLTTTNIANITLQKELLVRNLADLNNKLNLVVVEQQQAVTKVNKIKEMMKTKEGWIETPEFGSHLADKQAYLRTLDDSYFRLKIERDRLLKIYTPQSNEIKAIDYQLANLRKQKAESLLNIANMEL